MGDSPTSAGTRTAQGPLRGLSAFSAQYPIWQLSPRKEVSEVGCESPRSLESPSRGPAAEPEMGRTLQVRLGPEHPGDHSSGVSLSTPNFEKENNDVLNASACEEAQWVRSGPVTPACAWSPPASVLLPGHPHCLPLRPPHVLPGFFCKQCLPAILGSFQNES